MKFLKPSIGRVDLRTARLPPKQADEELLTSAHRAWRDAVMLRAGHQCEAIEGGIRCCVASPNRLFADHIRERKDGGQLHDVANGQALCGRHHSLKTAQARAARTAERH